MSTKLSGPSPTPHSVPSRTIIPPFAALRAFDAVARLGGMRRAAESLSIDHTVVSRHLRALETWIGVPLIERSQSGISLTAEGHRYHAAIASAIDGIASATLDLLKDKDSNQLHIWCVPGFVFQWLLPKIQELEETNPGLQVEIKPTDDQPDFQRHEADICIRYLPIYDQAPQVPTHLRSVVLAEYEVIPIASPEYLAARPPIKTAGDMLGQQLLHDHRFLNWHVWLTSHGLDNLPPLNGPRLWHSHLTVDAAKRGRGIALVSKLLAEEALSSNQLVEVGDGAFKPMLLGSYQLETRADRWSSKPIATFRNWINKAISR